jgi:hypothetical protein
LGTEQPDISRRTTAAVIYASTILAKRSTLRSLFYDALTNWQESQVLGRRRNAIYMQTPDGSTVIRPGQEMEERLVTNALTVAQSVSQDSANALMLIVDYSLQRFAQDARLNDWRNLGVEAYGTVSLNSAIYALANQARHLHDWKKSPGSIHKANADAFKGLGLDPLHDQAAPQFLQNLALPSYVDFEKGLLATPCAVLERSGWRLIFGCFGVDAVPLAS